MSVWQCAACDSWHDGAAHYPTNVPRDPWGRVERVALDDKDTPRYCSDECRELHEAAFDQVAS